MQYKRKNSENSWFELVSKDTETLEAGVYLMNQKTPNSPVISTLVSTPIYIKRRIESFNVLNENQKNIYEIIVYDRQKENNFLVQAKDLFDLSFTDNQFYSDAQNNGLKIWTNKKHLVEYFKLQDEEAETYKGVENIGWTEGNYFNGGFNTSNDGSVFTGSSRNSFQKAGTKEEQFAFLKDTFTEYPLVFFVFAYMQGGFFNRFLNEDHNQVLEIVGESSKGKSTVGKLCMSAYTDPARFASFNMTKTSITDSMKFYNDCFIFFDEIGEMKVKEDDRNDLIYTLANGMTKARSRRPSKDGDFVPDIQTRLYYSLLLGGEVSILKNGKKTGGIEARLCQIVLDKNTHLFENVTSEFIEDFNLQLSKNYGWLAPELVKLVQGSQEKIKELYIANLDYVRNKFQINSVIENRKIKILAYALLSASYIASILYGDEENEEAELLIEDMLEVAYTAIFNNVSYGVAGDDPYKELLSSLSLTHTHYFKIFNGIAEENQFTNIKDFYGYIHRNSSHLEVQIVGTKIEDFCNSIAVDKDRILSYVKDNGFAITDKEKGRKTKKIKGVNYYVFKIPLEFFEDKEEKQVIKEADIDILDEEVPDFDGAVKIEIPTI